MVALAVLQRRIHRRMDVPLNSGELWQNAIVCISKALPQLVDHIVLRQQVHRAMVLSNCAWQAAELGQAFQG